jgi:hypothetical protein
LASILTRKEERRPIPYSRFGQVEDYESDMYLLYAGEGRSSDHP